MDDVKRWSKDWQNFDWSVVVKKLDELDTADGEGEVDIGITKEEFLEYCEWLCFSNPDEYDKIMLYYRFIQLGMSHNEADFFSSSPDEFMNLLDFVRNWMHTRMK